MELFADPHSAHPSSQADETNSQFRLIITSMPTRDMSLNLLRDALKICNEPQQGMKANMLRTVHMDAMRQAGLWPPETGEGESGSQAQVHATAFARFVYSLCYLHATVKERASYGPPGWSVPYSFSDSDFTISLTQIHNLLAAAGPSGPAPFAALKYTVGEIIYGGRVTDDKDRRLLSTLLDRIFAPETLDDKPRPLLFDESPFQAPHGNRLSDIVAAVEGLPGTVGPECIGLHRNADITKDIAEANKLLEDLSSSITGSTARQQSDLRQEEELVRRFCTDMTQRLPQVRLAPDERDLTMRDCNRFRTSS